MQTKQELEEWWEKEDAWGYEDNPDDSLRKTIILEMLDDYERALDIGAGEGFITRDLPAKELHALEISDKASSRLPKTIKRVLKPEGRYDLVVATGVLYKQYDHESIAELIKRHSIRHVLVGGIKEWLLPYGFGNLIDSSEFDYHNDKSYRQIMNLYEVTS